MRRSEFSSSVEVPNVERMPGTPGQLMKRKCRRNVADVIHLRTRRLRHAATRIRRKRFQVATRPLGVDDRRLAASRYLCHPHNLPERKVNIKIFEVVFPRSADFNGSWFAMHFLDSAKIFELFSEGKVVSDLASTSRQVSACHQGIET